MQLDDCIKVARELEKSGVHALVLSAGFVSKAPMHVMRGSMPYKTLTHYMNPWKFWWLKIGIRMFGKILIPSVPFQEAYFLEYAKKFRKELSIPLIYVGGLISKSKIEEVLNEGFVAVQMARALINDPGFVNKMKEGVERSNCKHSNYCIGRMYTLEMKCHTCIDNLPEKLQKEIEKAEKN
jgi:2,4-dienoyl-CoA reductase-like NADH-dependent reductase (Old Yellow Enzyme family)